MASDTETRASRRNILVAALGALGGLVAGRLGTPDVTKAATGEPAILGQQNTADVSTSFENTTDGPGLASLYGKHSVGGIGVLGTSYSGPAVHGESVTHVGISGRSVLTTPSTFPAASYRTGVSGAAGDTADQAANTDETGVYGFSDVSPNSAGVWGDTIQGIGVVGSGDWGVFGVGNIGVRAIGATALYTTGKLVIAGRSGHRYVATGRYYKDVAVSGMTSGADVIATLRTRKSGYYIAAVVSYAGKFRVYLNKTATSNIYFNFLVLN